MPDGFQKALAHRLRELRVTRGMRGEDVAGSMRARGLVDWTRGTVTGIERGFREVTVLEAPLLAAVFDLSLVGMFEGISESWVLPGGQLISGGLFARLVDGDDDDWPLAEPAVEQIAQQEAVQKASRKLDVDAVEVAARAVRRWGHGLSEERDRRVTEKVTDGDTPRRLQALRGHITRQLVEELLSVGSCA